jgi:hypothetical protein
MRLTLEIGTVLNNPTAAQIDKALRSLNWLEDNSFAVLAVEDWTYMQTAEEDNPDYQEPYFVLEYQEGSLEEHYHAVDGPLTLEQVIEAFQKYAHGDESWREDFEWEKQDLS